MSVRPTHTSGMTINMPMTFPFPCYARIPCSSDTRNVCFVLLIGSELTNDNHPKYLM